MKRSIVSGAFLVCAMVGTGHADMVTIWDDVMASTIRADATMPGPVVAARNMAMVHTAIYDAVNSVDGRHRPYHMKVPTPPGTSADAAAAQAAYEVLSHIYPLQQAALKVALDNSLATIPAGPGKEAGIALGKTVGNGMMAHRQNDHAFENTPYTPGSAPGDWRPTPPGFASALAPGWGKVTPFAMFKGDQFRPPAPPALTSPEYTAAFDEVKALGSKTSAMRTADQTQIGIFWGYDRGGLGPPPILYNQILQVIAAQQGNTMVENARLFALANLAMADAGIIAWDAKYVYNLWRPIAGIREAGTDGNPDTVADLLWEPLGAPGGGVVPDFTPPFPAYTSGHATFGAAVFRTLADYYGTDQMHFTIGSDELPGVFRSYNSFSEASEENGQSRIYLGIHWSFDKTLGISTGDAVADYVFANMLQAVPAPGSLVPLAIGLAALAARRWQCRKRQAGRQRGSREPRKTILHHL